MCSDIVSGPVAVGISISLPFKGVHLLLGNDLAGDKVVVNPLLINTPCEDQLPDPIEQEIPDLYPLCCYKGYREERQIQSFHHEITLDRSVFSS